MKTALILSLLLFSAAPSLGDDNFFAADDSPADAAKAGPAARLVALERQLTQNQGARDAGALKPDSYQAFVAKFRIDLESTFSRVPPTPANNGLHAQILSRLGEKERNQALNAVNKALEAKPNAPDLLRAQAQIFYEQQNFPFAAAAAQQAWEASGRKDTAAWGLLKMSEGRAPPRPNSISVFRRSTAPGYKVNGASSVVDPGASAQAMSFMRHAIDARRQGHLAVAWANAQAAMNADPASPGVQKFYETVKADVQRRSTKADEISSAPITDTEPKPNSPLLPLLVVGGAGVTALGLYKVALSRGTVTSDEGSTPSPEASPEQSRRNYLNSAVLIGAPLVIGALVFGGPRAWRALAPTVGGALRGGQQSFQNVTASEAGALLPGTMNKSAGQFPGFTASESEIIGEAQQVLSSPQFMRLQEAYRTGSPATVNVGGRVIQYEPDLPSGYSGMALFKENGFVLGRTAFKSTAELQKTVLHELYRLATTQSAGGVDAKMAKQETDAAFLFSERAAGVMKK